MKLILPISFLIISGILFFVVIDPLFMEVKQSRIDVATYSTAIDNSAELQKTRDLLIDKYKNIKQEDKDRLNHFLPRSISNIELILEIEKIANLHGMPIKDIKFDSKSLKDASASGAVVVAESDPSKYLSYGIFPMEFTVEGDYNKFLSFLVDLEHNLRLVDVTDISFSASNNTIQGDKTGSDIYSYSLKIQTYWIK
jgi:hypothetical protein